MSDGEGLADARVLDSVGEELAAIRKQNRRRRIDSIHVLAALGIIGWYLTNQQYSLVSFSNPFEFYFFGFTMLSGAYLVLKINLVSIRDFSQRQSLAKLERGVSFLFFASFDGLFAVAVVDTFVTGTAIAEFLPYLLFITAIIAVLVSLIPALSYYSVSAEIDENIQQHELTDFIFDNPDLLEPGFEPKARDWIRRDSGWLRRADIYGTDSDGTEVVVEIEATATANDVEQLARYTGDTDDFRYILAALKFTDTAIKRLDHYGNMERREITLPEQGGIWRYVPIIGDYFSHETELT